MLVISIIALISLLAATVALIWHVSHAGSPKEEGRVQRPEGGGRAQRLRRRQARAAAPTEECDGSAAATTNEAGASSSTRSAKKRAKQARRQAAQAGERSTPAVAELSDADEPEHEEEAAVAKSAYELAQDKKAEQRDAVECAEAEEIRLAQEARKKREQAEFDTWKDLMSMDATGEDAKSEKQLQQRRQALCDRLKAGKVQRLCQFPDNAEVTELGAISAEFGMRCGEVIAEIRRLEAEGTLTGILDDRGQYIHFSMEELRTLATVIRSRGRICIAAVAQEASAMLRVPAQDAGARAIAEAELDALISAE